MNEGDHSDPLQRPESPEKDDSPPPYESIILEDSLHSKNQGVEDRNRHHEVGLPRTFVILHRVSDNTMSTWYCV